MQRLIKSEDKALGSENVNVNFYMKQTSKLDNACGLIACIHSIFNNLDLIKLEPNSTLQ